MAARNPAAVVAVRLQNGISYVIHTLLPTRVLMMYVGSSSYCVCIICRSQQRVAQRDESGSEWSFTETFRMSYSLWWRALRWGSLRGVRGIQGASKE